MVEGVFGRRARGKIDGGSHHFSNCITRPKGCRPSRWGKNSLLARCYFVKTLATVVKTGPLEFKGAAPLDGGDRGVGSLSRGGS